MTTASPAKKKRRIAPTPVAEEDAPAALLADAAPEASPAAQLAAPEPGRRIWVDLAAGYDVNYRRLVAAQVGAKAAAQPSAPALAPDARGTLGDVNSSPSSQLLRASGAFSSTLRGCVVHAGRAGCARSGHMWVVRCSAAQWISRAADTPAWKGCDGSATCLLSPSVRSRRAGVDSGLARREPRPARPRAHPTAHPARAERRSDRRPGQRRGGRSGRSRCSGRHRRCGCRRGR